MSRVELKRELIIIIVARAIVIPWAWANYYYCSSSSSL